MRDKCVKEVEREKSLIFITDGVTSEAQRNFFCYASSNEENRNNSFICSYFIVLANYMYVINFFIFRVI